MNIKHSEVNPPVRNRCRTAITCIPQERIRLRGVDTMIHSATQKDMREDISVSNKRLYSARNKLFVVVVKAALTVNANTSPLLG